MRYFGMALVTTLLVNCLNTATQASQPLIEYSRSGGIRGVDETLVVNQDGSSTLIRNGATSRIEVDSAMVERLQERLRQSNLAQFEGNYPAPPGAADMFNYVIKSGGRSVRFSDASMPEGLAGLVDILDRLLASG